MACFYIQSTPKRTLLCCAALAMLSSCASGLDARIERAERIAESARLERHDVAAGSFTLASWQKVSAPSAPVHVYIEGDGLAWLSRSSPSNNPTPKNPVGLALAGADPAVNVVYFARPCQYTTFDTQSNRCERAYWTYKRFAREVLASYQVALDTLIERGYTSGFHLIGYSGGANIAGLLTATRGDILSLRSVAGNLDNDFFTQFHQVSAMNLSLNMADEATALRSVPQHHFIGAGDALVPPAIFENYASKLRAPMCVKSSIVPGTTHAEGWAERWPRLLREVPRCAPDTDTP